MKVPHLEHATISPADMLFFIDACGFRPAFFQRR
jgi:hypothetical protein